MKILSMFLSAFILLSLMVPMQALVPEMIIQKREIFQLKADAYQAALNPSGYVAGDLVGRVNILTGISSEQVTALRNALQALEVALSSDNMASVYVAYKNVAQVVDDIDYQSFGGSRKAPRQFVKQPNKRALQTGNVRKNNTSPVHESENSLDESGSWLGENAFEIVSGLAALYGLYAYYNNQWPFNNDQAAQAGNAAPELNSGFMAQARNFFEQLRRRAMGNAEQAAPAADNGIRGLIAPVVQQLELWANNNPLPQVDNGIVEPNNEEADDVIVPAPAAEVPVQSAPVIDEDNQQSYVQPIYDWIARRLEDWIDFHE